MGKVKKAIIIVAGLNSRMMPIAKSVPKSLFPLGNKPIIHYLVEECLKSGIKQVIIVVKEERGLVQDYFAKDEELESILSGRGRKGAEALKRLKEVEKLSKHIKFATQAEALGECHAMYQAKKYVKREPVALLYGDYLYISRKPAIGQAIKAFEKKGKGVVEADARYIFDSRAFKFLSEMNFLKLGQESVYPLVSRYPEKEVLDIMIEGAKCDIGSPEEYWKTVKLMLNQEKI